mgnify:CR=1 FL=1
MLFHTVLNNKKEIYSNWLQNNILNLCDSTFMIPETYQYEVLEVTLGPDIDYRSWSNWGCIFLGFFLIIS